jgi:D-beta-D-heptose 7-phosphate kinase/D-beta-D-heptose 1-phosphate adenosyltransferase
MFGQLAKTVANLGNPSVLLVGDFMLDSYLFGTVSRISPEAPVPILKVDSCEKRPGGAGSVAMDLLHLGAKVTCLGVVGDDNNANILREELAKLQIDVTGLLTVDDRPTTSKQRIIGLAQFHHHQQIIRIDDERTAPLGDKANSLLIQMFKERLSACQIVCLQDYKKGVFSAQVCQHIIDFAEKAGKRVLVDPGPGINWEKYRGASLIKPNRNEANEATGFYISTIVDAEKAAHLIQEKYGIKKVVITLDKDGAYLKEQNQPGRHYPAKTKDVYDITGAGDIVLATLTVCLAAGCDCDIAIRISNIAAGIEIGKLGSASISKNEIVSALPDNHASHMHKVLDIETLKAKLDLYHEQNKRIVFTNGCFDIIYRGHIELLKFCEENGDLLVVGINSDSSVKAIKGPEWPINNQHDRAAVLAALGAVDYITVFDEPDPLNLIKKVRPDILVKGRDWANKDIIGREFVESYGGKVVLAPLVEGKSSTATIEKMKVLERES